MMVGIGIFAAFGAATEAAGSGILIAMLLGGSVAFATGMSAVNLGVNDPTEGGAFTWARDLGHQTLGLVAGFGCLGTHRRTMTIMASEVKQPRRTIPIAVVGGVTIAAVTYVGVGAITLGVLGAAEVGRQDTPLLEAAQRAIGQWGVAVVLAAAILAALAEVLGDL